MTKEELESKFEDCFDANTRASEGGYGPDVTDKLHLWTMFQPVIAEYTKQLAIEFAIDYAKSAISNHYVKPSDVEGDRMEDRYDYFTENNTKQSVNEHRKNSGNALTN